MDFLLKKKFIYVYIYKGDLKDAQHVFAGS
jgi:hypothetical protein